ncbi:hypothetical protein Dimus_002479 [Dionaea muscipula]
MQSRDGFSEELRGAKKEAREALQSLLNAESLFLQQHLKDEWIQEIVGYYQKMSGTEVPGTGQLREEVIKSGPVISEEEAARFCADFDAGDVLKALWDLKEDKAPGDFGVEKQQVKEEEPV